MNDNIILPTRKCRPGHCLCNATYTLDDPPEVGRRVQAYSLADGWEFIMWHNGDASVFEYWRGDLEPHPCDAIAPTLRRGSKQHPLSG